MLTLSAKSRLQTGAPGVHGHAGGQQLASGEEAMASSGEELSNVLVRDLFFFKLGKDVSNLT